jgi:thymidylate synthase ThyX
MISAKIIADSKNQFGDRITTMIVVFPRFILAEVNTHRMLSRNSASSRAIPFKKMLKMVKENPFIPYRWMKDHKGMQGNDYFDINEKFSLVELEDLMFQKLMEIYETDNADNLELIDIYEKMFSEFELYSSYTFEEFWLIIRDKVINCALLLNLLGLSKQICNRLLEPFMWHTAIITATEWENFFALRNHKDAEIHLQELAKLMMYAYNESEPVLLKAGEWHIPFKPEEKEIDEFFTDCELYKIHTNREEFMLKIATARCARVSYLTHDGQENRKADLKIYDKLANDSHWSPFEHCAKTMSFEEYDSYFSGKTPVVKDDFYKHMGWCGNFKGFIQLRKTFANENKKDDRVIKK